MERFIWDGSLCCKSCPQPPLTLKLRKYRFPCLPRRCSLFTTETSLEHVLGAVQLFRCSPLRFSPSATKKETSRRAFYLYFAYFSQLNFNLEKVLRISQHLSRKQAWVGPKGKFHKAICMCIFWIICRQVQFP